MEVLLIVVLIIIMVIALVAAYPWVTLGIIAVWFLWKNRDEIVGWFKKDR